MTTEWAAPGGLHPPDITEEDRRELLMACLYGESTWTESDGARRCGDSGARASALPGFRLPLWRRRSATILSLVCALFPVFPRPASSSHYVIALMGGGGGAL
mmetsp:Transcript_53143/g.159047  ORF Transcript_53143/g.159047 Transcript_53143/m.159047 type:complete len:102 (-) Transcript_53143:3333-3638(-)